MGKRFGRMRLGMILGLAGLIVLTVAAGWATLQYLRPKVIVTHPAQGPVVQAFYATGTVFPRRDYPIRSNIAGVITQLKVDKGDAVKSGAILAVIEDPELTFKSRQALAELEQRQKLADDKTSPVLAEYDAKIDAAQALLGIANREYKRVASLLENNAGSATDLDRALDRLQQVTSDLATLKAQRAKSVLQLKRDLDVAGAAVDIARWNLDQQSLQSPVDGVVLDRPRSLGTRVAINDALMTVADIAPSNLVMRAAVDEEDKNKLRVGQEVRMTLYSFEGKVFSGTVSRIYDRADADRRTFEVDVTFNATLTELSPGMTGELAFILGAKDSATVLPAQAYQNGAIWRVVEGRLQRQPVELGLRGVERIEILSPKLDEDAQIIISPVNGLSVGQRVRTEPMDPISAANINKPAEKQPFKGFN